MRLLPYPVNYHMAASHCDATDFRARMKSYRELGDRRLEPAPQISTPPATRISKVRCSCGGMGTAGGYDASGMERTGHCYVCDGTGWREIEVSA